MDISDREAVYKAAAQLQEDVGPVDILINNAGIVCCKPLLELPDKMIEKTYAVNILSHYWTIKSFLPQMIQQKRGHIVTIASVTGLIGTYGCTDYGATKFACIGMHEALHCELQVNKPRNVRGWNWSLVTLCLIPGTRTRFRENDLRVSLFHQHWNVHGMSTQTLSHAGAILCGRGDCQGGAEE